MMAMRSPSCTTCSGSTWSSRTTPGISVTTGISIFMDSRMTISSPSATICPSSATTCHTFAAISARISATAGDVIREHRQVGTRVRRATADDIEELIRLASVMLAAMGHDPSPEGWRQAARDLVPIDFEAGTKAAFVVDHPDSDGRLIASAAGSITQWFPTVFNADGRYGYVQWVATDPEFRRRGHGRAVMVALLDWFRANGVALVDLRATTDAEILYRSLGFTDVDTLTLRLRVRDPNPSS